MRNNKEFVLNLPDYYAIIFSIGQSYLECPIITTTKMLILFTHQTKLVEFFRTIAVGDGKIDAGGFNAAVSEQVGKTCDVVRLLIVALSEKMAQVMRKNFAR